ncbi:hypothetical protein ABW38_10905 [Achromobacter xylosoxidans]|uniref:flagellin N-terminal helical domain-containing protein n=1 Tax=Alcaligenes xylosoxydans xylosoxydans TaxID=85698 RepID=UPI0006AC4F97|nr:flagellin [Achromobacter xylosoxidans]KOQ29189.1 hypothetical protein ABW36_19625 [Achromobacter xylosoxidans]KOQ40914.1 hypothetical protein ABW37_18095 [Achromobacter xylosoxidans]KOQ46962.1 hypothetical protein ABW39_15210 [Achromobacter xylosoxidans]KOQ50208.1 hypothetical protein ABW38_10905 [Achromobacter xylosoxidans]KOQ58417.1 hypothetical protein ABW40_10610 [Achromobacter xylosoxidans]
MPSIRNQALSLRARTNLGKSESAQGVAMERLSSGLRINHAADDAAGESIAGHFTAQLRGQHQAARNANDGISLAQTIEGALGEMGRSLQRIRELAVQSQNGTLSLDDLQAIQAEIDQHLAEIERISHQTRFNNLDVLAQDVDIPLQIGVNDGDTIDINTRRVDTKTLELDRIDVVHDPRLGGAVDRTVIDTEPDAAPTAPPPAPAPAAPLPADGVKKDTPIRLFDFLQSLAPVPTARDGRPLFDQDSKVHYLTDASGNANGEYVVSGSDGNFYDISISSTGEVSFKPKDAPPTVNLKVAPMKRVNNALGQVDSLRGELGAMQNRLGSVITNLNHTAGILSQARSRIEDADYAVETSNLTRQQILQQASKVALTQANQLAQNVLALLKED